VPDALQEHFRTTPHPALPPAWRRISERLITPQSHVLYQEDAWPHWSESLFPPERLLALPPVERFLQQQGLTRPEHQLARLREVYRGEFPAELRQELSQSGAPAEQVPTIEDREGFERLVHDAHQHLCVEELGVLREIIPRPASERLGPLQALAEQFP